MRKARYPSPSKLRIADPHTTPEGWQIYCTALWEKVKEEYSLYIRKTTAAERMIVCRAMDNWSVYVVQARRLLAKVLEEYFEDAEQKSISASNAADVGEILHVVEDALLQAETGYSLTVGNETDPMYRISYESAKRAVLVRDVERLRDKLGYEVTGAYLDMEDEKALPILRQIARERGVTEHG